MLSALLRAFANLFAPPLRRVVGLSFGLAMASFAALWFALAVGLAHSPRFGWRPLDWLVDSLGVVAALALSWLLFQEGLLEERAGRPAAARERYELAHEKLPLYAPVAGHLAALLTAAGGKKYWETA